jgi:carbamoyltransferase
MTSILGISAYYHDSAAALVVDGRIVAAAQEERFTRKKHDDRFPEHAVNYCLSEAGLTAEQLDYVGFYEKPLLKFDRLLETYLAYAPQGFASFARAMPIWLRQKLFLSREIRKGLGGGFRKRLVYTDHHESHAASAFFPSPFEEAAVLTVDGVGEWASASFGIGQGSRITLSEELHFPHSLGLLYSAFTYFCGFRVNSGEYKLMGLAPYGEPKYADAILDKLLDLKEDGSFVLDLSYFDYPQGLRMTSDKFHRLFGGPPRSPESEFTEREMDLAASIQKVTEEILLRMARHVHQRTGKRHLCLAGGVALNSVANGRILTEGPFEDIWIQPAAGDAGGALGTALFIWHQLLGHPRTVGESDSQQGSLLGVRFAASQVAAALDAAGAVYESIGDEAALLDRVAGLLDAGKAVGWMQGRMEFGPRALGSRSILGDARDPQMQATLNLKVKFRESFRPFAPVVLTERAADYFDIPATAESPYMLLVLPVRHEHRLPPDEAEQALVGLERRRIRGSTLPAITHVDGSARLQTVDAQRHGRFHRLLQRFEQRTGCGVLINTSFNVRGEPIVCTPEDAYRCFMATDLDVLVIEDCLLFKDDQPAVADRHQDEHLSQFALD